MVGNLDRAPIDSAPLSNFVRGVNAVRMHPSSLSSVPKTAVQSLYAAEPPLLSDVDDMDDCARDCEDEDLLEYEPRPYSPLTFDDQAVQHAGFYDNMPHDQAPDFARFDMPNPATPPRSSNDTLPQLLPRARAGRLL